MKTRLLLWLFDKLYPWAYASMQETARFQAERKLLRTYEQKVSTLIRTNLEQPETWQTKFLQLERDYMLLERDLLTARTRVDELENHIANLEEELDTRDSEL
jgi:hypothetical protein